MRKFLFELVLLGIAIGLTVEVIKSAIPYLPIIWLAVLVHYTWEGITYEPILEFASKQKNRLSGRRRMFSYGIVAMLGAALLVFYWWGLNSFFGPRITKFQAEQHPQGTQTSPKDEIPPSPPRKESKANLPVPVSPAKTGPPALQPLRRPIEVQADMLRSWIGQTAAETRVNEMWLSQIFQRTLDNIPGGPDVDVPSALRFLDSKGEVEILETSKRKYPTWWGETFQEDIRFKIKNSASGSSPEESIKGSKSERQQGSSQAKAPERNPTFSVTNPSGSIVNQGSTVNAPQTVNNYRPPVPKPLVLNEIQATNVSESLKPFSGQSAEIYLVGDSSETQPFAVQLKNAMEVAGLNVTVSRAGNLMRENGAGPPPPGVSVSVADNRLNIANALGVALRQQEVIEGPLVGIKSMKADTFVIYIAPRK